MVSVNFFLMKRCWAELWVQFVLCLCVALWWIASSTDCSCWSNREAEPRSPSEPVVLFTVASVQNLHWVPLVIVGSTLQSASCGPWLCVQSASMSCWSVQWEGGGTEWSVRTIWSWSAVVQQETRGEDELDWKFTCHTCHRSVLD